MEKINGVGIDIVQLSRIKTSLAKKILCPEEINQFDELPDKRKIEYLGGRFAIKEAYFKASGHNLDFKKICVLNNEQGKPVINLENCLISISHDGDYAIGIVFIQNMKQK